MECNFCNKMLSSKSALNIHQKTVKYCLKIQGKENIKGKFLCEYCDKDFFTNNRHISHIAVCKLNNSFEQELDDAKMVNQQLSNEIISLKKELDETSIENIKLGNENEFLKLELEKSQESYKELSLTAVRRPTSTKNVQINNYIKNMAPLLESDISGNVNNLTLEHHAKGAEGYAEYALEFPFKDKIVCVDVSRNKIKYKNEDGDVIEDVGFRKMMMKLCDALKGRSYDLSQEHYESLSDKFTEKELDEYNFLETALAISKYANGRENDFCSQIVKMISKKSSR